MCKNNEKRERKTAKKEQEVEGDDNTDEKVEELAQSRRGGDHLPPGVRTSKGSAGLVVRKR